MRFKLILSCLMMMACAGLSYAQVGGGPGYPPPTYQPNPALNLLNRGNTGFGASNSPFLNNYIQARQYSDINRNIGGLAQQTYDAFGQTGLGVADRSSELQTGRGARFFYFGSWYPQMNRFMQSPISTGGGGGGAGSFSSAINTGLGGQGGANRLAGPGR